MLLETTPTPGDHAHYFEHSYHDLQRYKKFMHGYLTNKKRVCMNYVVAGCILVWIWFCALGV